MIGNFRPITFPLCFNLPCHLMAQQSAEQILYH